MDEVIKLKCASALEECKKHAQRINTALKFLEPLFPLTEAVLNALSDEQTAVLDQFLYRFIDILNRLEKLGVLTSAADWQYFRSLRNNFAHEYPERSEDIVNAINALYASWDRFMALYVRLAATAGKDNKRL